MIIFWVAWLQSLATSIYLMSEFSLFLVTIQINFVKILLNRNGT